jgi:hypothetical protein
MAIEEPYSLEFGHLVSLGSFVESLSAPTGEWMDKEPSPN